MPKWTEYTSKDTLADNDEVMLYDATAKANKRGLMSKFWDYVVDKMATAVISKLETDNKTIIGAINALNGNSLPKIKFIDCGEFSASDAGSAEQAAKLVFDEKVPVSEGIIIFADFIFSYRYSMIIQKYARGDYGAFILFGCNVPSLSYHVKVKGVWQ
nr:MAG TPA: hypothetical protein [Caudoviricetes sp.]